MPLAHSFSLTGATMARLSKRAAITKYGMMSSRCQALGRRRQCRRSTAVTNTITPAFGLYGQMAVLFFFSYSPLLL